MGLDDKRVYLETAFNNWIKDRATWISFRINSGVRVRLIKGQSHAKISSRAEFSREG